MPDKLTDDFVKKIPAPDKGARTIWDSELTGFGVRVFAPTKKDPRGARSFFLNYRVDGVERRFTIGKLGDWTALAARQEAKQIRRAVDMGEDPALAKRERREAPTVQDLADRYEREHLPKKSLSSQKNDKAMIRAVFARFKIGPRRVSEIGYGDIAAIHAAITADGKPVRANRILAVLSKMFALALLPAEGETKPWRDQAQGNPCKGVARNQEEGCERFFSTAELAALSDGIDAYGATPAANAIRLVFLTGCRPGEAMTATWDQFDTEPGVWVKPSQHTKQRKVHRVPLPPPALELIARVRAQRETEPRATASPYVFPGQKTGAPLKQLRSAWEAIVSTASVAMWRESKDTEIASIVADLEKALDAPVSALDVQAEAKRRGVALPPALTDARLYDARHTFASVGAAGGLGLPIIGRLLGHTQTRTTQRYAHLADDPLREAAAKISGVIAGAGKPSADVVPFKGRGGL
jgi:integrase